MKNNTLNHMPGGLMRISFKSGAEIPDLVNKILNVNTCLDETIAEVASERSHHNSRNVNNLVEIDLIFIITVYENAVPRFLKLSGKAKMLHRHLPVTYREYAREIRNKS